jgi:hypothetical protein
MKLLVMILLLAFLLMSPSAIAYDSMRPCILAIIGDGGAIAMKTMIPYIRAGDYIMARECWRET